MVAWLFASNRDPDVVLLFPVAGVHRNAPYILSKFLIYQTFIGFLVPMLLAGTSVQRDTADRLDGIVQATPVGSAAYVLGRFLGAWTATVLVFVLSIAGLLIGWSGQPGDQLGTLSMPQLLTSLAVLALPNLLFTAAVAFAIATLTRRASTMYLAGAGTLTVYGFAQGAAVESGQGRGALWDPFGLVAFDRLTRLWTVHERNAQALPGDPVLLMNRVVWLVIAGLLLAAACIWYRRVGSRSPRRRRVAIGTDAAVASLPPASAGVSTLTPSDAIRPVFQLLAKARFEVGQLLRAPVVLLLGGFAIWNMVHNLWTGTAAGSEGLLPYSGWTAMRVSEGLSLFVRLLILLAAGTVVWRERECRFDGVSEALPVPAWSTVTGQFVGLAGLAALLGAVGALAGAAVQVLRAGTPLPLLPWILVTAATGVLPWAALAAVALAIQTWSPSRAIGYGLTGIMLLLEWGRASAGIDPLWSLTGMPDTQYSGLLGFGPTAGALLWFLVLRVIETVACLALAAAGLPRERRLATRGRGHAGRPVRMAWRILVGSATAAALTGAWILWNTRALNPRFDEASDRRIRAHYETAFRSLADKSPRVEAVTAEFDLSSYPRSVIRGSYRIRNETGVPLGQVLLTLTPFRHRQKADFQVSRPHRTITDSLTGSTVLAFDQPWAPGDSADIHFDLEYTVRGFRTTEQEYERQPTFTLITAERPGLYLPVVGFAPAILLRDPATREPMGLPELPRRADPAAGDAARNPLLGDLVRVDLTVRTPVHSMSIASAPAVAERVTDGVRVTHFTSRRRIPFNSIAVATGPWSVATFASEGSTVRVLAAHWSAGNRARMADGALRSLALMRSLLGEDEPSHLDIAQFPDFGQLPVTARAFPGFIAWNEDYGFLSTAAIPDEVDAVFSTAAHEAAHEWWGLRVVPADARGSGLILEGLPQLVRALAIEQTFSPGAVRQFREEELDRYLARRGSLTNGEHPLILAEDPGIYYPKATLALGAVAEAVGVERTRRALQTFFARFGDGAAFPVSLDLLDVLEAEAPDGARALIEESLADIVLWDNQVTLHPRAPRDSIDVQLRRWRSDSIGRLSPLPVNRAVEFGTIDARGWPEVLGRTVAGQQQVTVRNPLLPGVPWRGIDPRFTLIERNPADNFVDAAGATRLGRR